MNGDNPLDASAVHPEAYPVVQRILADIKANSLRELMGDANHLRKIEAKNTSMKNSACPPCRIF